MRWRDAGEAGNEWGDMHAVLATQPWDSALARAMRPKDWQWYGPQYPVLVEIRDHLRQINVKTPLQKASQKAQMPRMTTPPWEVDAQTTTYAPEPATQDDIDAHLERLNGAGR